MRIILMIFWCLFLCFMPSQAQAQHLLFIPMDNRPVCYGYVLDTLNKAKVEVRTPPFELLPSYDKNGDVDGMFNWLEQEAPKASGIVLSTDALIYGGLVGSRTHNISAEGLISRVERLLHLINKTGIKVYAYSTIMRTPRASSGRVEPVYYAEYGPKIFRYTQLQDKLEVEGLNRKEKREYKLLEGELPIEIMEDWQERRDKNSMVNGILLAATEIGNFEYFVLGKDDTAEFSASHRDSRRLAKFSEGLGADKYQHFVGADQLGLLLALRAVNDFRGQMPFIFAQYNQGAGETTVPTYEDGPIAPTVTGHIWAAGGYPAKYLEHGDLVLLVNTPVDGKTLEAGSPSNTKENVKNKPVEFTEKISKYLAAGYRVSVGDVAYGNGSDNAMVQHLFTKNLAYKLASYSGWNTASNTIGYAIGQGCLSDQMSILDKEKILRVRYADEWAYQANIRMKMYESIIWPNKFNGQSLGVNKDKVQATVQMEINKFMNGYMPKGSKLKVSLPWQRMFEVFVQ